MSSPDHPPRRPSHAPDWALLCGWALVSVGFAAVPLAAFTPFDLLALPVAVAGGIALARRTPTLRPVVGMGVGVGAILIAIAVANRGGPGDVCTAHSCVQKWDPRPRAAAGALVVIASAAAYGALSGRRRPPTG